MIKKERGIIEQRGNTSELELVHILDTDLHVCDGSAGRNHKPT